MQTSLYMTERRGSLFSENSISSEAYAGSSVSPISSEELLSEPLPKPSPKPSLKPPSNITAAFRLLKDRYECVLEDNWNSIQLRPGDYDKLWRYLETEEGDLLGYIEDKVHLDYDPNTFNFVVRMPTSVHEYIGLALEKAIDQQLDIIKGGNDEVAMLVRKIDNSRSTSIFLEDGARHDPDGQFRYEGFKYPPLIIEVANSQSKKDGGKNLPKLADHYIMESNGSIQTVIGIYLDYRGSKRATISIWRRSYGVDQQGQYLSAEEVVVSQEFRKADGSQATEQSLRLPLTYFLPSSDLLPPMASEPDIIISHEKLARCLEKAEQTIQDTQTGLLTAMPVGMRKRKREETPPETLSLTDERRFAQEESKVGRLADEVDKDWKEV